MTGRARSSARPEGRNVYGVMTSDHIMRTNVLRSHWVLTTISGVCLIANIGLVLEIASALNLGRPFGELVGTLFLTFMFVGPSILALSVGEGAYVFLGNRSVEPADAYWMRIFRVLSVVNATIPIIFGAFAFAVYNLGYFWR